MYTVRCEAHVRRTPCALAHMYPDYPCPPKRKSRKSAVQKILPCKIDDSSTLWALRLAKSMTVPRVGTPPCKIDDSSTSWTLRLAKSTTVPQCPRPAWWAARCRSRRNTWRADHQAKKHSGGEDTGATSYHEGHPTSSEVHK